MLLLYGIRILFLPFVVCLKFLLPTGCPKVNIQGGQHSVNYRTVGLHIEYTSNTALLSAAVIRINFVSFKGSWSVVPSCVNPHTVVVFFKKKATILDSREKFFRCTPWRLTHGEK